MPDLLFETGTHKSATISPCGLYRYDLTRRWGDGWLVNFIMLNPSKADASRDDNTLRRCIEYAKAWNCGRLVVTNLFAFRSTNPVGLRSAADPIGPSNPSYVLRHALSSDLVVCGWGADPFAEERAIEVLTQLREAGVAPHALAITKKGRPGHPLFLRGDLRPVPMGAITS